MLIVPVPVGPWQANCHIVALDAGSADHRADCVLIDPGMDAEPVVRQVLDHFHLRLAGAIATHGHIDHVADAQRLTDAAGVPLFIHPADEHLLTHPAEGLSGELAAMSRQLFGERLQPPRRVVHLADGSVAEVAGVRFTAVDAPGHTPGCTLLRVDDVPIADAQGQSAGKVPVVFTGDVVFQGSVGRTDLPGSDPDAMTRSLRSRVLPLPDEAYLLPGHGAATTMAAERAANPFLQHLE